MRVSRFPLVLCVVLSAAFVASVRATELRYDLKSPANVSLAVYDSSGRMVRELMRAKPQEAGSQTVTWDGLDGSGQPVPAGDYTWKLLSSDGLKTEYLLNIGTSFGINHWPGVHGGASGVTVSGDTMLMAGAGSETQMGIAASKLDGTFLWSAESLAGWADAVAMTVVGEKLWLQYGATGQTAAASPKSGEKSGPLFRTSVPVISAKAGKTAAASERLPLQVLDNSQKVGWDSVEGITEVDDGHAVGLAKPQESVFLSLRLPKSVSFSSQVTYRIRLSLAPHPESADKTPLIQLRAGLKEKIQGGHSGWVATYDSKKNPTGVLEFTSVTTDGRLDLRFYCNEQVPVEFLLRGVEVEAMTNRMDASESQMVIAASSQSKVLWVDPTNMENPVIEEATVPDVQDIALLPDGTVLAISGESLVTLNRQNPAPQTKASGLSDATRLAIDTSNGDILVFRDGTSQQVVRLDKNFKPKAAYGRDGGRRQGRYVPEDFAGVSDIASDNRGGFLVAEFQSAPRRVVHLNAAGNVVREWLGGQMFYHSLGVNPTNPSQVLLNSQFGSFVEYAVNYEKREAKVVATWKINDFVDPVFMTKNDGFWIWIHPLTIEKNGKRETYYFSELAKGFLLKPDYEKGVLTTVALSTVAPKYLSPEDDLKGRADDDPFLVAMRAAIEESGKNNNAQFRAFSYADLNGDLQMQPDEFRFAPDLPVRPFEPGKTSALGPDLSVWEWSDNPVRPGWTRNVPMGFTEAGIPIWEPFTKAKQGPVQKNIRTAHIQPAEDGTFYTVEYLEGDRFGRWWTQTYWEGHGFGWPATMLNASRLRHRDAEGNLLWESSAHHSGAPTSPKGNVDMPWRIAGLAGDVIGLTSQTRQACEFFSSDGLYIGALLDQRVEDGLPDYVYKWWRVDIKKGDTPENKALINYDMGGSGKLAKLPNGDIVFFAPGWNSIPVFRVLGFNAIHRQSGTIKLTVPAPAPAFAGTGLSAEYFANTNLTGEAAARRVDSQVWFGFAEKAPGSKIPWPEEPEITGKPFSVRWTGFVTPRVDDDLALHFYPRNAGIRVWVDGEQVVNQWQVSAEKNKKVFGLPLPRKAGRPIPIKIEYRQLSSNPEAHLVWEGLNHPVEHIPTENLTPEKGGK